MDALSTNSLLIFKRIENRKLGKTDYNNIRDYFKNEMISSEFSEAWEFVKNNRLIGAYKRMPGEIDHGDWAISELGENYRISIEGENKAIEYIKNLKILNLELSNKKLKREIYFAIIGFIAGLITANAPAILLWLKALIQI